MELPWWGELLAVILSAVAGFFGGRVRGRG